MIFFGTTSLDKNCKEKTNNVPPQSWQQLLALYLHKRQRDPEAQGDSLSPPSSETILRLQPG